MNGKIISIVTPKKIVLDGIIFGPEKPKNIFIFVHGLCADMFGQLDLFEKIINKETAVLAFNNRGSGVIKGFKKLNLNNKKPNKYINIGMAHEVFSECVDDIGAAVKEAKKMGAKNIFLIGHSTGCQKSIYYLSKNKENNIKGTILLAPLSDYADMVAFTDPKKYKLAIDFSRKLVASGKAHELLPNNIWSGLIDAQRFLSLYTPDSVEEIFTYASNQEPKTLKKVKQAILVVLAEKDEYRDRPSIKIADWFKNNLKTDIDSVQMIKNSMHNFTGYSSELGKVINNWLKMR